VQGLDLRGQPFPDPSYGLLARLDEQLAVAVAADVEPKEVKASIEGRHARLVLVEGQASRRQPRGKPFLDLLRLFGADA
jgi:hypothetical protein